MSNELVPLDYQRYAYNAHQGTDLQHHNSLLSAEQAAQINDTYDIELYFGTHGAVAAPGTETTHNPLVLPSQKEYDEAAAVVNSLRPGDTLFVEGYGFKESTLEPFPPIPSAEELPFEVGSLSSSRLLSSYSEMLALYIRQGARDQLEDARRNYKISAWDYARQLAALKGVRTVHADLDAFDKQHVTTLNEGNDSFELLVDPEPKNPELRKNTHARRELQVPNTVKDWALEHFPEAKAQNTRGRKPKLAVLFGRLHEKPMEQAFTNLGLQVRTNSLSNSSLEERSQEQVNRAIALLATGLMEYLAKDMAGSPPPENKKTGPPSNPFSRQRPRDRLAGLGPVDPHKFGVVNPDRYTFRNPKFRL